MNATRYHVTIFNTMKPVKVLRMPSGEIALIDPENWAKVQERGSWHINKTPSGKTYVRSSSNKGRPKVLLHVFLTGFQETDHINGNALDNRIDNLRSATRKQNMANQRMKRTNRSGYKGVSWNSDTGKWRADISRGPAHYLGQFTDPVEAAKAYDIAALNLYGEFALTNERMGLL